jgi:iron complex outermembrane receptor protein
MKKSCYSSRAFTALTIAAALALFALPAMSQESEAVSDQATINRTLIEEVIVFARKREESLMEIPTAVSVFGSEELDRRGFFNLEDISDFTAGLYYSNQGGQVPGRYNEAVRFRGLDTNQSAPSQQIATVFVDGAYFPGGLQGLDFSNVERVEVIKGPQSATFGRSTFAGAVSIITKRPSLEESSGRFSGTIADYGTYDTSFSYESPIIADRLGYRVSGRQYGTDGQYRSNGDGGRLGEERTTSVQGTLFGQVTDNLSASFRIMYSEDEDGPPAAAFFGGPGSLAGTGGANAGTNCFQARPEERANGAVADYYCGELPRNININDFIGVNTTVTPFARNAFGLPTYTPAATGVEHLKVPGVPRVTEPGLKREMNHYVLDLNYDINNDGFFNEHGISSLSGYGITKTNWVRDTDLTSFDSSMSQDPSLYEFWSQELRITSPGDRPFRWSLGMSYFKAEYTRHGSLGMNVAGKDAPCTLVQGVCIPPPYIGGFSDFPKEGGLTKGVFGALSYDITDRMTVDFEWRYQDDEVSQDNRVTPGVEFVDNFTNFLPRLTLSYHPMENSTVWATYSKGNMPGFFNAEFTDLSESEKQKVRDQVGNISLFNEEETLINHEVGWKQTLFGGNAYYSLIAYKMDWQDLKTRQSVPIILDDGTDRALNVQFNAGNAEITGVELEGGFSVGEHFSGTFTLEKVNAEYGKLQCSFSPFKRPQFPGNTFGPRDCSGSTPARYPDTSYSFGLNWVDNLGSTTWDYFLRADGNYMGKAYSEEANFGWYGKFWRVNLRGGFQKDMIRVEFYADNVLDDDHYLAAARWSDFSTGNSLGFLFNQGVAITPASKRVVGMKVAYEF